MTYWEVSEEWTNYYLILSQVDDAMLPIVIERLEKNGLHCRVIDTRNESRVAEE